MSGKFNTNLTTHKVGLEPTCPKTIVFKTTAITILPLVPLYRIRTCTAPIKSRVFCHWTNRAKVPLYRIRTCTAPVKSRVFYHWTNRELGAVGFEPTTLSGLDLQSNALAVLPHSLEAKRRIELLSHDLQSRALPIMLLSLFCTAGSLKRRQRVESNYRWHSFSGYRSTTELHCLRNIV